MTTTKATTATSKLVKPVKPAAPTAAATTPLAPHKPEVTSPKAAAAAASVLRDPAASPAAKTAAASALTQVEHEAVQTQPAQPSTSVVETATPAPLTGSSALAVEVNCLRAENERLAAELADANRRADEQAEWARRQRS